MRSVSTRHIASSMRYALLALTAALVPLPVSSAAQDADAFVLPRGMVEVQVGGTVRYLDSRFGAGNGLEPITTGLHRPLLARDFPSALPLEARLERVFEVAGERVGTPLLDVGAEDLLLGRIGLDTNSEIRRVAFGAAAGIAPRLQLRVSSSVVETQTGVIGTAFTGGLLGINPDAAGNAALLRRIDPSLESLGMLSLLPTATSPLGRELQRRVLLLTSGADSLQLPGKITEEGFATLLATDFDAWLVNPGDGYFDLGDTEVALKYQFAGTRRMRDPIPSTPGFRGALEVAAILPTGSQSNPNILLDVAPWEGEKAIALRVYNDVVVGKWFWATLAGSYRMRLPVELEQRIAPAGTVFPGPDQLRRLEWNPGEEWEIVASPRLLLEENLAIGAHYRLLHRGADDLGLVGGEPLPGAPLSLSPLDGSTLHQWGIGAQYSFFPPTAQSGEILPFAVGLHYLRSFAGTAGVAAPRSLRVEGRVFYPLWNRR